MSLTSSKMLTLNTNLIDFTLRNTINNKDIYLLKHTKNKPVLITFICNHCPYVIHIIDQFVSIANLYLKKGFAVIAISSNEIKNYPEDSPKRMREIAMTKGFNFPYCYDDSQSVAKLYKAACTPDFYCFNKNHKLVYRGQFDSSRPSNNIPVTGKDLILSMDDILHDRVIKGNQKPSIGCNIKWR